MKHLGLEFQPKSIDIKLGKLVKRVNKDSMIQCGAAGGIYPQKHSLLSHSHDIRFEQKDPSCVANSLVMSLIILHSIIFPSEPVTEASIYAIYYWSRQTHGAEWRNTGTYIFSAIEAVNHVGIPLASSWPENKDVFTKPDWATYTKARPNKPLQVERIYDFDVILWERIKQVIGVEQRPIQFGMNVDKKFVDWENKNEDDVYDYVGPSLGGHAMTIVGYDDINKNVEVINSHGRRFGYNGVFRIGYDTVLKYLTEFTVIKSMPKLRI